MREILLQLVKEIIMSSNVYKISFFILTEIVTNSFCRNWTDIFFLLIHSTLSDVETTVHAQLQFTQYLCLEQNSSISYQYAYVGVDQKCQLALRLMRATQVGIFGDNLKQA